MPDTFSKPLLTCWMGDIQTKDGRAAFAQAGIPTFSTPEAAVEAYLLHHRLLPQPAPAGAGAGTLYRTAMRRT